MPGQMPVQLSSCLDSASSRLDARRLTAIQLIPTISPHSYDSNLNVSRDDKKNKFASTMEFVEDYLNNVVSEAVPFANEEKNKLTFEVRVLLVSLAHCTMQHDFAASVLRVAVLASLSLCLFLLLSPEHGEVWSCLVLP